MGSHLYEQGDFSRSAELYTMDVRVHPGACRAPTYLQGVTQGEWIPAECLGRNVIACKLGYIHRGTLPGQK